MHPICLLHPKENQLIQLIIQDGTAVFFHRVYLFYYISVFNYMFRYTSAGPSWQHGEAGKGRDHVHIFLCVFWSIWKWASVMNCNWLIDDGWILKGYPLLRQTQILMIDGISSTRTWRTVHNMGWPVQEATRLYHFMLGNPSTKMIVL